MNSPSMSDHEKWLLQQLSLLWMIFEIFMIIESKCTADEIQEKSLMGSSGNGSCHLLSTSLQLFVSLPSTLSGSITLPLFILDQGGQWWHVDGADEADRACDNNDTNESLWWMFTFWMKGKITSNGIVDGIEIFRPIKSGKKVEIFRSIKNASKHQAS